MGRPLAAFDAERNGFGMGRELFAASRANARSAEEGAISFRAGSLIVCRRTTIITSIAPPHPSPPHRAEGTR